MSSEPSAPDARHPPIEAVKPTRKRKRIVISCTECHRRKQKCDRASPCANCVARGKESSCHYENEAARKQQEDEDASFKAKNRNQNPANAIKPVSATAAQVATLGYAKENGNNTLGLFKKIEDYGGDSGFLSATVSEAAHISGLREKYKSLIRQLPSKPHIEKLVETFFRDVNPTYFTLDESTFKELWSEWSNLSFSTLNKGPLELSPDLRFFPGLLFQVIAQAMQFQPPDYDPSLDCLKYAAAMSLDDLASDYSESGVSILTLLGKRHTTLITVQAGFLRTSFLKNCGLVPESWHSLSITIRDAQEIGLHKEIVDHQPRDPGQALENLWTVQLRRRMWLLLSVWDVHMALVLGRPTTIDLRDCWATFPIDAPVPKNRREVAPMPRSDSDPPTPLTALLWTAEITAPLRDILALEKEGPHPKDPSKIEKMHNQILLIGDQCPAFFRSENPDTTWDNYPDCYWLPRSRPGFANGIAFTIMALHRPYIFTNSSSRAAALNAALDILRAQQAYFGHLNAKHYKMFNIVLNTFDAIVVLAAIHIIHPWENREHIDDSLQHFDWAMERFQTISQRNVIAKGALGVLKAIHVRFMKALGLAKSNSPGPTKIGLNKSGPPRVRTPLPTPPIKSDIPSPVLSHSIYQQSQPISSTRSSISTTTNSATTNVQASSTSSSSYSPPDDSWNTTIPPTNFDVTSLAPLQPMHDLLFNDLTGAGFDSQLDALGPGLDIYNQGLGIPAGGLSTVPNSSWQFEGDFGQDSFWGFMNNYNP
ncbi:hypothetical protein BP6252_00977 [Coleophoma cylindrospora]|uniref:Zn(2)-C6 fungal-type domain-containing protein n=1 Tax=Coleophoma cylindrospora TaxID=1849047 RepID=A0A3D8SRL1_9HELO|nr:hypothetical protein BP6252_00977 [Coleophoma cylindrospora]